MSIKISADSTCDLSPELIRRYDVSIVPLTILMEDKSYKDRVEIVPADVFKHVAEGGELCTTSAVNVADYFAHFANLRQSHEAVIHISISEDFSACYRNACAAAADFDNVYIVDSRNLSSGHGHIVVEAGVLAEAGLAPAEIVRQLNELTPKVEASFVVERLDYLKKGGRCSSAMAFGANLFNIKPCIGVIDGKMDVVKKYRGSFEKCLREYIRERLENRTDIRPHRIFITYSTATAEIIQTVRETIGEYAAFAEIIETSAGCTVSCHCGPNTLGILFIRK